MLPKIVWDWVFHRKYRNSLWQRLGVSSLQLQEKGGRVRIWVHAVSMGETRALAPLVAKIRAEFPESSICFSSTTETGQEEAKRSFPGLEGYFFLPLDFSWTINRLVRKMQPDLLILCESDFWYNLFHAVPQIILVNGKLSEKSFKRFRKVPFFSRRLFSRLSLLCLQSERYKERFQALGVSSAKITVTGNLKFDQPKPAVDRFSWRNELGIGSDDPVVVIGSTHAPEEEELLTALEPLSRMYPHLKLILVPRHPERFDHVAHILEKRGIAFARHSTLASNPPNASIQVLLMDAMGLLTKCYQIADVAIVAGSFGSRVGGHNIFEPASLGVPVLFGPRMESQRDLVELVLSAGAGRQVTLEELLDAVDEILCGLCPSMKEAGLHLAKDVFGSTERTWEKVRPIIGELLKQR